MAKVGKGLEMVKIGLPPPSECLTQTSSQFLEVFFRNPTYPDLEVETMTVAELRRRIPPGDDERVQRPHFHMVVLYTGGEGVHEIDFVQVPCRAGTLLHFRPGQVQRLLDIAHLSGRIVLFTPAFLLPDEVSPVPTAASLAASPLAPSYTQMAGPVFDNLLASAEAIEREYDQTDGDQLSARIMRYHLQAFLLQVERALQTAGEIRTGTCAQQETFLRFQDQVEAGFRHSRTIEDYARLLNAAPKTLNRATLAVAGMSAKAFIDARVALEAKRLLAHTALSVGEIAVMLGFSEATNFVKFFRREADVAPNAFRRFHRPINGRP